jgi:hypothetical protein
MSITPLNLTAKSDQYYVPFGGSKDKKRFAPIKTISASEPGHVRSGSRLCKKSNARRRRRKLFSTIVPRGGSMLPRASEKCNFEE